MLSAPAKKILLVPLDWGLGHTTRCVPIIRTLLELGHEVFVGGTGITNAILTKEFPDLSFYSFPSYAISYPKKGNAFMRHIMRQLPQMARTIRKEQKLTKQLAKDLGLDIIISDNRFGVRAKGCKNIFISHQLNLSLPDNSLLEYAANRCNRYFINKYDQVLVPDWENHLLSGILSSADKILPPVDFLGSISRWRGLGTVDSIKQLLVILSGPEPQRTLLENMLIEASQSVSMDVHIVRALPNDKKELVKEGIHFYNHLSGEVLEKLARESDYIVSRAGYTTILDLVSIKKHAILIPTPGQTEQEYLAKYLKEQKLFHFYKQNEFTLHDALNLFDKMEWSDFPIEVNQLKEVLEKSLVCG